MSRRRALTCSLVTAATISAGAAFGQTAAPEAAEEPLRRLDGRNLAGGDYGVDQQEQAPLAGGDYGVDRAGDFATDGALRPLASDPLSARSGSLRRRLPRLPGFPADDPYAPLGVRAGAFVLRPTIEAGGGYDSNPDRLDKGGKGSAFYRLRGGLDAVSDWERHEVAVRVDGQMRRFTDSERTGYEPQGSAVVDGRLDVTERTQLLSEARASVTTSRPGDPDTPTGLKGDEIQKSFGGTLGVSQTFNRLSFKLEGLADRYLFNDSKLRDGTIRDNGDRIYNAYELRLRGAYDLSPMLQPFAEVAIDTRDYDLRTGDDGRRLGSDGYAARVGATFEAARLITGELAVGYGRQRPNEKELKDTDGLLIDGAVIWSPSALTTVTGSAKTALQETTLAGSGGVLVRSFGLAVEHRLRRNFIVTARADYERSRYRGIGRIDDGVTLALETEYRLSRSLSLISSVSHERLNSSEAGEDYKASIVEVGLRLRR
ncbi:outer membrane beta-barrel protein [Hansschlegelia quercus]|uniref:Outer membrane beta-barrel protein n=1 Tax=Hansschlegelia quercus TaxID=2528245 RepID=A0A4Q9GLJ9_9HYPH|nr:outer membrane beta-barrel protein [Hansschlegelia quercus]TBN55122.1 hypothetical protein EYR15_03000 [Hansschlegelia quercus]